MTQSNNASPNLIHFDALYPENFRENEVKKILEYVKHGNSCQIVGLPGVGRSNILALLAYNRKARMYYLGDLHEWFHFVYMDFSEVKKRSLFEVLEFIMISLSYSLEERGWKQEQEIINSYLKEALEFHDDLILFQALKKSIDHLAIEKELSIVFLFNKFDEFIPQITEDFFSYLRILRNRAKYRFTGIFSLTRPLEDVIELSLYAEFYEFLIDNVVYLPIHERIGIDFRFSYLEKLTGKNLDENIKEQLISLTGGHCKLAILGYEILLGENTLPENLEEFLLKRNRIKGALTEIWQVLLPEEQTALLNQGEEKIEYLENVDLVKERKIQIPLLKKCIESLTPTKSESITYDAVRNEIFHGSEELTDKLSPSEFRLLRYLIQNADKVCEKEEIIQAVWKDSATQEGVTDQALDQIIYRLRKKVEDNPNNPLHIHTIKGRGYKFAP